MSLKLNNPSKIRVIQGQDIKEGSNPHLAFIANTTFEGSVTRFGDLFGLWANFQSLWATINLPKSPTFLGNFCKGVNIFNFSGKIIFGQLL